MNTNQDNATVKVGLLGFGNVGQGVARICSRNSHEISRRAGSAIEVKSALVRDLAKAQTVVREHGLAVNIVQNPDDIINDPEIDIVVEALGGEEPALSLVMAAIAAGKHIVTANKALIAVHGNDIFTAAHEQEVAVAFEPAVAGGIPVIKAIREGLAANVINSLAGIINGTGNFILSEMAEKARSFEEALADAQALGYAEADPTFDVEGIDAAHKLTILASIAFGIPLQFGGVYTEGISSITREDVAFADELGYRIKHLGVARRTGKGIELRVHPTLIPESQLIANVNGPMNAVLVQGDAVGPTLYYGQGAGSEPTGSAVVADLVDIVRTLTADPNHRVPHLAFQPSEMGDNPVLQPADFECPCYLRLKAEDRPGVLAEITRIMGDQDISIEAIIQKEPAPGSHEVPIIMLTRSVREGAIDTAMASLEKLDSVKEPVKRIRVALLD